MKSSFPNISRELNFLNSAKTEFEYILFHNLYCFCGIFKLSLRLLRNLNSRSYYIYWLNQKCFLKISRKIIFANFMNSEFPVNFRRNLFSRKWCVILKFSGLTWWLFQVCYQLLNVKWKKTTTAHQRNRIQYFFIKY